MSYIRKTREKIAADTYMRSNHTVRENILRVGAAIGRPFTGKPRMGFRVADGNGRLFI